MTSMVLKSVPEIFRSASLTIIPTENSENNNSSAKNLQRTSNRATSAIIHETDASDNVEAGTDVFSTSAYFRDATSKRAKVVIPILIKFLNDFERKKILKSGAIQPVPSESGDDDDENVGEGSTDNDNCVGKRNRNEEKELNGDNAVEDNEVEDSIGSIEEKDMWDAELDLIGETHEDDELEMYGKNEIKFECTYKCVEDGEEAVDLDDNVDVNVDINDDTNGNQKSGKKMDTVIESIKVLSTSLVDDDSEEMSGIRFDVEIAVCLLPKPSSSTSQQEMNNLDEINQSIGSSDNTNLESDLQKRAEAEIARTNLEIRAFLVHSNAEADSTATYSYLPSPRNGTNNFDIEDDIQLGLQALDMGLDARIRNDHSHNKNTSLSYFSKSYNYYLPPQKEQAPLLKLDILPALLVSVRGMSAPTSKTGATLISLVIYHSNVHNEIVTITDIAVHPGHSRLLVDGDGNQNSGAIAKNIGEAMLGGGEGVINMTKSVRWGYASGTSPSLPLVLKPQEAIATVLQINANEVMNERAFLSPIGIRAAVGDISRIKSNATDIYRNKKGMSASIVMVTADAMWTTSPIVKVGSTDAFRISLSLHETVCTVGSQVVVGLRVLNLSTELRDLMLIMAKDNTDSTRSEKHHNPGTMSGGTSSKSTLRSNLDGMNLRGKKSSASTLGMSGANSSENSKHNSSSLHTYATPVPMKNSINNAVVSEVNGYTFGCWGLSCNDDGTTRHSRDHDLLAVDAALLLGEVKGQHAIEAELRFVPFTEGALSVPNLKLYDKVNEKWYDCDHTLKIISVAKQ